MSSQVPGLHEEEFSIRRPRRPTSSFDPELASLNRHLQILTALERIGGSLRRITTALELVAAVAVGLVIAGGVLFALR